MSVPVKRGENEPIPDWIIHMKFYYFGLGKTGCVISIDKSLTLHCDIKLSEIMCITKYFYLRSDVHNLYDK